RARRKSRWTPGPLETRLGQADGIRRGESYPQLTRFVNRARSHSMVFAPRPNPPRSRLGGVPQSLRQLAIPGARRLKPASTPVPFWRRSRARTPTIRSPGTESLRLRRRVAGVVARRATTPDPATLANAEMIVGHPLGPGVSRRCKKQRPQT